MGLLDFISGKKSLFSSDALQGAVDHHSHILPGVDDGIRTMEEALAVLEYEASAGIKTLWCTPHVMEDVPNRTEILKERFSQLQDAYNGPVELRLAAEYMLDNLFEERLSEGDLLTMDDDVVLVETSGMASPYDLNGTLGRIMAEGYRPLFAHPERCRYLMEKDYERLRQMGVMLQLNLGSIAGYYGNTARKKAEWILSKGLYNVFGSDCHRLESIKGQFEKQVIAPKVIASLKNRDAKGRLVAG